VKFNRQAAPTAADTALATMHALSAEKGVSSAIALAKYLETPEGRELYAEYDKRYRDAEQIPMTKAQAKSALDGLAASLAAKFKTDKFRGMLAALDTKLGKKLYELGS
jgi:hypothetical protein